MISDEYVKDLFSRGDKLLRESPNSTPGSTSDEVIHTQLYRGRLLADLQNDSHDCNRHMKVFNQFNVIPRNCFSCYKVVVEPRTVVELLKLMVIFEKLKMPRDNTRKCMVECRESISGTYKGLIYCTDMKEGEAIAKWVHKMVSVGISNKISVTLKRGCSEYEVVYPDYAHVENGITPISYNEEWQQYENIVDKDYVAEESKVTSFNHPSYSLHDARIMRAWLKYAATIGDLSYLKISDEPLSPWDSLQRPEPFQAAGLT